MRYSLRSLCALAALGALGCLTSSAIGQQAAHLVSRPITVAPLEGAKPFGGGLFGSLGGALLSKDADVDEELPAELLHVQISRAYLAEILDRSVELETDLNDLILDTRITGTSNTRGRSEVVLLNDPSRIMAEIRFKGSVHSQTIGHNGPAVLHNTASTPFEASKRFIVDDKGMQIMPAVVTAQTCSNTTNIETSLPGLRGRVAQRVAWRRSDQLRSEADGIASRHAEERIARQFNEYADPRLGKVHDKMLVNLKQLQSGDDEVAAKFSFSSTPTHIRMVALRLDAPADAPALVPPTVQGDPRIVAHVHRSVLRRMVNDPTMRDSLTMVLGQLSAPKLESVTPQAKVSAPKYQLRWTPDQTWLVIEVSPPKVMPAPTAAAQAN